VVEQDGKRLSIVVQARLGRRDRIKAVLAVGVGGHALTIALMRAYAAAGTRPTGGPARCSGWPYARHAGPAMRGPRLAKARGPDWWLSQPWLEPWHQEQHRWSEDYARKAAEWEERNWLVASMPPDVRAAYDAA
jgi:hypothetical protein